MQPRERASPMDDTTRIQEEIDRLNEESGGAIRRYGFDFDRAQIEAFLCHRSADEAIDELRQLAAWQHSVNRQNHDGVTLTRALVDFLAGPGAVAEKLAHIEGLRQRTRHGEFDAADIIQRDLEYHRYNWAYREEIADAASAAMNGPYDEFAALPTLPPQTSEPFVLDGQHLIEARRVAFEAYTLLRFLQEFAAGTSRPILLVGNDRYGRQWGVEPLEDYLDGRFTILYPRVPSHKSTRLTVPNQIANTGVRSGFDRQTIRSLGEWMPHVIIVDARNVGVGKDRALMRMSRGCRDYANWFIAFNDLRADGDGSKYEYKMPHPPNHYPELKRWFEFVQVQRKIRPWVKPGETYSMTMWAPEFTDQTVLGDFKVQTRPVEYGSDAPQVVLANPLVYRTDEDSPDLHENLRGNRPYYFDGPERHVRAQLLFGFGEYGVESRVVGSTTDEFVEAVQQFIRQEAARLAGMETQPTEDVAIQ